MMTTTIYVLPLLVAYIACAELPDSFLAIKKAPMRTKPIAAYTSSFKELVRQSDVFIDKTLLVKYLLDIKNKNILLNLPKKWGKSINLHMLKTFVEIERDKDGNQIQSQTESVNYRLFKLGEVIQPDGEVDKLKRPLKIAFYKNVFQKYQGKHPVILLRLGDINWSDFNQVFEIIKTRISEAFVYHSHIVEGYQDKLVNENITAETKQQIQNNLKTFKKILEKQASEQEFIDSLSLLCQLLHVFYDTKPFLLIDDWDGVVYSLIFNSLISSYEARHMTDFYSSFFNNSLVTNAHLEKCIMTGTLRGKNLFAGLKDIKEYHSTISALYHRFGFVDDEVEELYNYLDIPEELRERAGDWYDGYRRTDNSTERIYSPVSIANFVSDRKINNYRLRHKHDVYKLMVNNFKSTEFRNRLRHLISDNELSMSYIKLSYKSFFKFAERFRVDPSNVLRREYENIIWSYFHDAGYFTYCHRSLAFSVTTRIINDEIRNEILTALMDYYKEKFGIASVALEQAIEDLVQFIDEPKKNNKKNLISSLALILDNIPKELVNIVVQYVTSSVTMLHNYRSKKPETFYYKDPKTKKVNYEIFLTLEDILYAEDRAVLITAQIDAPSAHHIVKQIKEFDYKSTLNEIPNIANVMFIGINVMPSNDIDIYSESELFFGNT